jgi:hypothetical protein
MATRTLKLKSHSTNTLVELPLPQWQVELLRCSNGKESINDISRLSQVQSRRSAKIRFFSKKHFACLVLNCFRSVQALGLALPRAASANRQRRCTVAWLRTGFSTDARISYFDLNKISKAKGRLFS